MLPGKKFAIKVVKNDHDRMPQVIAWLKRNSFQIDSQPSGYIGYIICDFPKVKFCNTMEDKISESLIYSVSRFLRDFIYVIKRCPIDSHDLFEDAITAMANYGQDTFGVWFSSLPEDEQLCIYTEFEKHAADIIRYFE